MWWNLKRVMGMERSKMRNITGCIVAFALGLLLSGIGTIIMVLREVWQSNRYGFPVETDDVVRYSVVSSAGSVAGLVVWILLLAGG